MALTQQTPQAIALNRFGLGARPEEAPPADPRRWLLGQFDRYDVHPASYAALPDAGKSAQDYAALLRTRALARRQAKQDGTDPKQDAEAKMARQLVGAETRETYRAGVNARMAAALASEAPFVERLTHFWSNHFAISTEKPQVALFAANFEAQAIRPHVLGRFEDMLVAVERHPAMLFYLDQFRSVGPGSMAAERVAQRNPNRTLGLNENLAREIMELHTLGVRTGYTQADVTDFARALTGWSIGGLGGPGVGGPMAAYESAPGAFLYRPNIHEPGVRTIMGKRYNEAGERQAGAILHDLATAPATAHHVSLKLARHFVSDDPPPALVERLTQSFVASNGDLPALYRTLVDSPEAWAPGTGKFKNPWDWSVSSLRALGRHAGDIDRMDIAPMLTQLGQPVWRPGSPAGYDDIAASWVGPDALVRRVELAQRFATNAGDRIDARALAQRLMPGSVGQGTTVALAQADTAPAALALLLVSPEFQRR
jgi:uncharacterized protein (DUF1800 family)